jgi:hypothetical protein
MAGGKRRWRGSVFVCGCLVALLSLGPSATAERVQEGNLEATLNGAITPQVLPRRERVPVAVHLAGRVLTTDRSPVPRVNWIRLELAWRGVMDTKGLSTCPKVRLINRLSRQALKACSPALVGRGSLSAQIFVPNQQPFWVRAKLLAFNGKTTGGRPVLLVHAFAESPPVAFVIPFTVHHQKGLFSTVLTTTIRKSVGPWPHVASFQLSVGRRFWHHGAMHSYTSASCPAPKGFTAGFSVARATYVFSRRRELTVESTRSCRTR